MFESDRKVWVFDCVSFWQRIFDGWLDRIQINLSLLIWTLYKYYLSLIIWGSPFSLLPGRDGLVIRRLSIFHEGLSWSKTLQNPLPSMIFMEEIQSGLYPPILINQLLLESFSWSISDWCDRMGLFQLTARRLRHPNTKDPHTSHILFLPVFLVQHNQMCRSMFSCDQCSE